jgi:peroxiredoxin
MKWLGLVMIAALPALALAGGQGKDKKGDQPKPADPKPADVKPTEAKLEIGKAAPAFELKDLDGKAVKLADYKGKIVVLEWFNPECPFVVRQHSEGPLKDAAAKATKDGVVWLAINSSGPGKEGNGVEKNKKAVADWKMEYPVLVDEDGTVGMAYGSKNTPTMYIIDAKGMLAYHGAIDNAADGKPEVGTLVNYVESALAEMKAGKAVSKAETKPYGCGVKYAKPKS